MTRTLYIIGNGFDMFHKLPTGYNEFHRYVSSNNEDLELFFENYFDFERSEDSDLWSSFERDLQTFKWKEFYDDNNYTDWTRDDFKPSEVFGLEDDLSQIVEGAQENIRMRPIEPYFNRSM